MSRLDLLKQGSGNKKSDLEKSSKREDTLVEKKQTNQNQTDDLDDEILHDEDFKNELETDSQTEYSIDDDDNDEDDGPEDVNVIEIDLDENRDLEIDSSLIDDEDSEDSTPEETPEIETEELAETNTNEIVEGSVDVDYSEKDIKLESEYVFDQREQAYHAHVKVIKNGGLEINSPIELQLGDIVRISVTLTELKEQVGCEAQVVSIFPRSIRSGDGKYRYIVQFIGPNATETERVLSKYLLGYKLK